MNNYAWQLALRSVFQNRRRNLATAAAVVFGYISLLLVSGYGSRVTAYLKTTTIFLNQSGHVAVFKDEGRRKRWVKPNAYSLSAADSQAVLAYMKGRAEFDFAAPYLQGSGLISNGSQSIPFLGRGLQPSAEARIREHAEMRRIIPEQKPVLAGQSLWSDTNTQQVSLARGLAKILGRDQVFDTPGADRNVQILSLDFDRRLSASDADISSIFSTGFTISEDLVLQAPLELMQGLYNTDKISYLSLYLKDGANPRAVAEALENEMKKQGIGIDAFAWDDAKLNPEYVDGIAVLDVTIGFVSLIVLFVVMLSILNTLTIGLAESRREIGTLLAIGYKARNVAMIFTVEALLVTSVSLFVAAAIGHGLILGITAMKMPFQLPGFSVASTFQLSPTPMNYIICAAIVLGLVLIATYVSCRRYAGDRILTLLDPGA